jgi:hypothetical protein
MSYSIIGFGATYTAPIATKLPTKILLAATREAPPSGSDTGTPGLMDPGKITPERCKAAGWWWDEVAQQCLKEAPAQPAPQPDPTIPPPTPAPDVSLAQLCAEQGGCWDEALQDCFVCMDEEGEPSPPPPVVEEPPPAEDNTALYAGIALLLAAGLAGGYFLISRKKKSKGTP